MRKLMAALRVALATQKARHTAHRGSKQSTGTACAAAAGKAEAAAADAAAADEEGGRTRRRDRAATSSGAPGE
jgi:hypothetical protein